MNLSLQGLLIAHEYIAREMQDAKNNMEASEWSKGHINGLKEGQNAVERAIHELAANEANNNSVDEEELAEKIRAAREMSSTDLTRLEELLDEEDESG